MKSIYRFFSVLALGVLLLAQGSLLTTTAFAAGPTCYVDASASGANTGNSWADAYTTVQDALADPGCTEIWVAEGVYYPDEGSGQTNDDRTSTFQLQNGVALYGGFNGTETARSQRDPAANITILSGDIDKNDTNTDGNYIAETTADIQGNNAYHVVTGSGTNNTAVLDGFTITAGQANGQNANRHRGGGMYNDGGSPTLNNVTFSGNLASRGGGMYNANHCSPTLTNVTFSGNSVNHHGGGMYNENYSSPALTDVTFSGNSAFRGGGMYNGNHSSPALTDVTFSSNSANRHGGGMYNGNYSSPALTDVTFSSNSANRHGGGMYNERGSPTLTNVTFSANSALRGGGMYDGNHSSPALNNVTFSANSAGRYGGGMYNTNYSSPALNNVIIANSTSGGDCVNDSSSAIAAGSANNLIEDSTYACGLTNGTNGNIIGQDPNLDALTDFGGPGKQVFPLHAGSPAIDAGTNTNCPATDQRGAARPAGTACDIGAFEFNSVDFGDLPNAYNGTTFAQNGARHFISPALYLGACADVDTDGQPDVNASGDDSHTGYYTEGTCAVAGDDEDGIDIASQPEISNADGGFVRRWKANVHVAPSVATAYLYGWIDFDHNSTFDADELAVATVHGGDTTALLEWTIPTDVAAGNTYARFRLSTATNLGVGGWAPDGEVEDYQITIRDFLPGAPQCNDAFYQTRANPANNYRFRFDQLDFSTNPIGEIPHDSGPSPKVQDLTSGVTNLNAIGFNIQDGYIYAMTWDPNSPRPFLVNLARINPSTGGFQVLGEVLAASDVTFQGNTIHQGEPLQAQNVLNAGDVDRSGNYYVGSSSTSNSANRDLAVIDLTHMTFSVLHLTDHLQTADFAFNPQDGNLYAVRYASNQLIKIDPATGVITTKTLQSSVQAQQGGAVFDQSGNLYALINSDASGNSPYRVYRIKVSDATPALEPVGEGSEPAIVNDAAGCLISRDYGDLPDSYDTLKASGGASHVLLDGNFNGTVDLFLGTKVDADTDGFVDGTDDTHDAADDDQAIGTGTGNGDDEDGITLATPLVPGTQACIKVSAHNETGNAAHLYGWFDWNSDGHFDTGELVNNGDFNGGSATIPNGNTSDQNFCFTVPNTATFSGGKVFYRFRLTTASLSASDWGGGAPDGEVEDYATPLACIGNFIWNDSTGTTQDQQDASDTGVSNLPVRLVWAGPNGSIDTAPNQSAQNDDRVYTTTTDANGVYGFCSLVPGTYQVQLAHAPTGLPEAVAANAASDDFHDSDGTPVTNGFTAPPVTITDVTTLPTGENGNQDTGSAGSVNGFPDRQVNESIDFGFRPTMADYGDAPDTYGTTTAAGGPSHTIDDGLYLGACVDAETNGQPNGSANGDDTSTGYYTAGTCATAGDDEDGVQLVTPLLPGTQACVQVTAHNSITPAANAHLYAWFDWNGDGLFSTSEALSSADFSGGAVTIPNGGVTNHTYCFDVPATATFNNGRVHMRFRLTTASLSASDWGGTAPDGEVEDHWSPLACVGNYIWDDTGGTAANTQDTGDQPLSGVGVRMTWAGLDGTFGTTDDVAVNTTTDAQGRYAFCGLTPNSQVQISIPTLPTGLNQVVLPNQGSDVSDSDGTQPGGVGSAVTLPVVTVPDLNNLAAGNWVTGENANEDNSTQTDPALTHNYPDGRTNLTLDVGFRKVNGLASKGMATTNQTFTTGSDVAVGEILTYETTLRISPGVITNLALTDVLDKGLAFQQCESITVTGTLSSSLGQWSAICQHATVTAEPAGNTEAVNQGRRVVWNFGNVTNSGTTDATITVRYQVVVLDNVDNISGTQLHNTATWTWDTGSASASASPVTILEPDLSLSKDANPKIALPDEPITFTLTVAHTAQSETNAYDVVLTDPLPSALHYVAASLTSLSGPTPTSMNYDAVTHIITVTWDTFPLGSTARIAFQATLDVPAGSGATNTASLTWSSLPGDVSAPQTPYNNLSTERFYDPANPADVYRTEADAFVQRALPKTGFAPHRVTALPPQKVAYDDLDSITLEIPKLGVSVPIVGVPRTADGWDLTWLWNNAGWLEGTAFPTWAGNTAITAHVYLPNGEPGPFVNLYNLRWGDKVIIHADGKRYTYEVRYVRLVKPNDTSPLGHRDRDWVTLITCKGYDEATNDYTWRVIVQAVLVRVEPEP